MTFEKLLSIPKSFWVSLHFFSFKDAIKLPVVVRYNTKIQSLKGAVIIKRGETVRKLRPEPAFTQAIRPKS